MPDGERLTTTGRERVFATGSSAARKPALCRPPDLEARPAEPSPRRQMRGAGQGGVPRGRSCAGSRHADTQTRSKRADERTFPIGTACESSMVLAHARVGSSRRRTHFDNTSTNRSSRIGFATWSAMRSRRTSLLIDSSRTSLADACGLTHAASQSEFPLEGSHAIFSDPVSCKCHGQQREKDIFGFKSERAATNGMGSGSISLHHSRTE
jgi:hypothetical protein